MTTVDELLALFPVPGSSGFDLPGLLQATCELVDAGKDVADGWNTLVGPSAHTLGCRCGGVGAGDNARIAEGDLSNLHTCARLVNDVATHAAALSRFKGASGQRRPHAVAHRDDACDLKIAVKESTADTTSPGLSLEEFEQVLFPSASSEERCGARGVIMTVGIIRMSQRCEKVLGHEGEHVATPDWTWFTSSGRLDISAGHKA